MNDIDYNKPLKDAVNTTCQTAIQGGRLTQIQKLTLLYLVSCWLLKPVGQKELSQHLFQKDDDSGQRQTREVVRSLRVEHRIPILSDKDGYRLPTSKTDIINFLGRMESEAKKRAESSLETYRALKETLGVTSAVFDTLEAVR